MSSSSRPKGGNEPWRNRERHYCAVCNVWMGSDRQSILLHEQGKKHQENLKTQQQYQRQERAQEEKQAALVQNALQSMEAAAQKAMLQDAGHFGYATSSTNNTSLATSIPSTATSPVPVNSSSHKSNHSVSKRQLQQEKKEWESRKKHRQHNTTKQDLDETTATTGNSSQPENHRAELQRLLNAKEGYYTREHVNLSNEKTTTPTTTTYLEGVTYGDILEEDMPIQLWTGSSLATAVEQQQIGQHHLWQNALVVRVRPNKKTKTSNPSFAERWLVDVAYLVPTTSSNKEHVDHPDDETIETSVPLSRIRIVLGAPDEKIPSTLEEARIMALGGRDEEQHDHTTNNTNNPPAEIDEATGLSGWSTVSVKRTTVRQELKEERARLRQQRHEAAAAAEKEAKKAELRRMEEAKAANADDSALGAFDVWSRGHAEGYKGVKIHQETHVQAEDKAKKLATGAVAFKKAKPKKKKQNRRTTSADD